AVMVGIKLFGEPAAPLAMAPTVPAPAPSDPRDAVPDPEVPEAPEPAAVEEPVQEAPAEEQPQQAQQAPRERPAQGTGSSRPQQGSAAAAERATTPSTPATPRVDPEAGARLAHVAADGAEAATIDVSRRSNALAEDRDRGDAQLSADQVRAVVNRERAAVTRCYETEARRLGQAPRMRLDVEVTIGASGTVTSAIARGQGFGNLTECIERSVRRWRFPASGGTTRTSIPFVFQGREQ